MSNSSCILAIAQCGLDGEPTVPSREMLTAARVLAEGLDGDLVVATATQGDTLPADGLLALGARRVYRVRSQSLDLTDAAWLVVQAAQPIAVLLPDGQETRIVAARIAARLECDLVGGCTALKVRDGTVEMGRPCLAGRAFARLEWRATEPIVITVAPGAFPVLPPASTVTPELVILDAPAASVAAGVTIVREVVPTPEAMNVNDADILVAGGGGVGGPEGFGLLLELARRLGGTVAASRVAVDRGWIPSTRQVGLTGKTVSPRLYLAVGISGAPQHIAGIRSAGKVVAINRDPKAPIFQVADLAVVADLHEVIPGLLDRLPVAGASPVPEGN